MLLVLFRSGGNVYGIDARRVIEVIPRVGLREFPHAPSFLSGLLAYRGGIAPVIDFGILNGEGPSRNALSTRVILTEFQAHDGRTHQVGILAESVSQVVDAGIDRVVSPAMSLDEAPYLGAVVRLDDGLVQLVSADQLLTDRMQDALYGRITGAP